MRAAEVGAEARAASGGAARGVRAEAALVALVLLGLYLLLQRGSWFGDARGLLHLFEKGTLAYHHRAYLPAAHAVRWITRLDAEWSLRVLSAASAALGCGIFHLALARIAPSLSRAARLFTTALLAGSPAVAFFATGIEVHALVLPFAGLALLWAARVASGASARSPVLAVLLFLALCCAHVSAALWLGGLFVFLAWDQDRLRPPRRLLACAALLSAGLWAILFRGRESGAGFGELVVEGLRRWTPAPLWHELVVRSGLLVPLALLALPALRGLGASRRARALAPPALAVLGAYALALSGLRVQEEGGYFLAIHPLLALLAGAALARLRAGTPVLCVLAAVQVTWTAVRLERFEHRYEHAAWVEGLAADLPRGGGVIAATESESHAVMWHAPLAITAAHPALPSLRGDDVADPRRLAVLFVYGDEVIAAGGRLAITRSLYEREAAGGPALVQALEERYGAAEPSSSPEVLLFPAGAR